MSHASERRRKPREKVPRGIEPMWVTLQNVPGRQGEVRAKVVDMSDIGLGIQLAFPIRENETVVVNGLPGTGATNGKVRALADRRWLSSRIGL